LLRITINNYMFIYKISNNTNGKIYIGITTKTVLNRFQRHCVIARTSNKHNKKYLHYAMMKYGWINFSVGTIEECNSIEELKERESFWIKELDSNNPKIGYNLTKGGDGLAGYKVSRDIMQKVWDSNKGRNQSIEEKQRRSATMLGLVVKDTSINNLRAHSISVSIPIIKFDLNMNILKEYSSIYSARKDIDYNQRIRKDLVYDNKLFSISNDSIWRLKLINK